MLKEVQNCLSVSAVYSGVLAHVQHIVVLLLLLPVAGRVSSSTFRLFPGQDGQLRTAFNTWLDSVKSDSTLDQVPDCEIETGVFKVHLHVHLLAAMPACSHRLL